jgi:hypothetical protein
VLTRTRATGSSGQNNLSFFALAEAFLAQHWRQVPAIGDDLSAPSGSSRAKAIPGLAASLAEQRDRPTAAEPKQSEAT